MIRSQHSGSFLIVEGDIDSRVYKRFIKKDSCRIIPAYNKDNSLEAVAILDKDNFKGTLAIVDADYWHVDNIKPESPNVFLTDTHDLETMILSTGEVVDKLFSEFGHTNKIKQLNDSPINIVLNAALPIGYLRWFSDPSKDNLGIRFRELLDVETFEHFIDAGQAKLKININKLVKKALSCSESSKITEKHIN